MWIFDLDGTLALIEHRRHLVTAPKKDWRNFYKECVNDEPNIPVINILISLYERGEHIQIWSGRSDEVLYETFNWISEHIISRMKDSRTEFTNTENRIIADIFVRMRSQNDYTHDDILKESWLKEILEKGVEIKGVFDDRDKVVAMWRKNGIPCFQVAPGAF